MRPPTHERRVAEVNAKRPRAACNSRGHGTRREVLMQLSAYVHPWGAL